ncbi:MAG: hypothetical protein LUI09_02765 [Prevotellaceae bacterium]|nr:hypothetical protein [Prevotellaceae bacterium]
MNTDYQDYIDDYLLGRMTDEERLRFERMLDEDSELREALRLTRMVSEELKTEAELRERMRRWDKEMDEQEKPKQKERLKVKREMPSGVLMAAPVEDTALYDVSLDGQGSVPRPEPKLFAPKKRRRRWQWLGGIAAVLVVGLVISTLVVGRRGSVSAPEPEAALRGSDDLEEIRLLMEAGKWEEALAQIDGDMLEARDGLENVCAAEGEEEDYAREECKLRLSLLSWLKVQALLGLGRKDEALQLLDSLAHSDDEDASRADSLYLYIKANQ